jgi:predicted kinase
MPLEMRLLIGLPASGKTMFAKELMVAEPGKWYRVNWDELRIEMGITGLFNRSQEDAMQKKSFMIAEAAARDGSNLIIDNTNLNPNTRNRWRGLASQLKMAYKEVEIDTPLAECIKRDADRERSVGRAVIERMALFADKIDFSIIKGGIVLLDIDGTIADCGHRREKLQPDPLVKKDWHAFYQNVVADPPIVPIIDLAKTLEYAGYVIYVVSGRPIQLKGIEVGKETVEWLANHNVPYKHLFMRNSGDSREDVIIKQEILDKLPKDRIVYVLDDRSSVISMWRRNGLTALQVADGNF